jgi:hypothetical protein
VISAGAWRGSPNKGGELEACGPSSRRIRTKREVSKSRAERAVEPRSLKVTGREGCEGGGRRGTEDGGQTTEGGRRPAAGSG